jgi:NAD(P)-dependent dehydrogenase (short-subunit alcohol dehydrogenase family)
MSINTSLENKTILVTGAKGQIGSALCNFLEENKAKVIRTDVEDFDVTSIDDTYNFFQDCSSRFGSIDVLINNAGIPTFDFFTERKKEDFLKVLEVNVWGTFNCIRNYVKIFDEKKQGAGSIINVGSIYGSVSCDPRIYPDIGNMSSEVYGASKAGIIQMTKHFAVLLAEKGIRVNCVSPGGVFNVKNPQPDYFIKKYNEKCPMKRMASTSDILGAFLFFSSDTSSYVTGQNLIVDGGFSAW